MGASFAMAAFVCEGKKRKKREKKKISGL